MPDSLQLYRQADAELARLSGIDAANPAQLQSDLDLLLRIVAHLRAIAVAIRPTNGEITAGASSPAGTIRAYAVEDVASIAGTHGGGGGGGALSLISQAAAEAGTEETARSVSALRLKQAFDAYLAAWVGAAPGALNTLDELAAALSDDANFASSVTTALAGKLNSSAVSAFSLTLLDDADAAAVRATIGAGADYIKFDASEFIPRTTLGCGIDSSETATNRINRDGLLFDPATQEFAQAWFHWPEGWLTATATFFWQCATGTGSVVWSARLLVFTDGDAIDSAFGTAQTVTDAAASANTHRETSATAGITPGGTVGARKRALLGISRDPTAGADDMALDAMLTGVLLLKAS